MRSLFVFAIIVSMTMPVYAELASPKGSVVLTVTGDITETNSPEGAKLDLATLRLMPRRSFVTKTEWTEGDIRFTGVPFGVLLDHLGATGDTINAAAADGYALDIPRADLLRYGAILAFAMDGKPLVAGDKGPLWIMFPWDEMSQDDIDFNTPYAVWQLTKLTVQ